MISLVRYEVRNKAGEELFFILMKFSYLNFLKVVIRGQDHLELLIRELFLRTLLRVWHKECSGRQKKNLKSCTLLQFVCW
jgi:hypothetical protein